MSTAGGTPGEGPAAGQVASDAEPIPDLPGPQAPAHPGAQPPLPMRRPAGGARPARADGRAVGRDENAPGLAEAAVPGAGQGSDAASRARLLEGDELQRTVIRWKEIQAHFVDEPRTAVEQADALVAGLMQQLTALLSREHAELEQRWAEASEVSTEELRQSLRRYRFFFERLLAV